MPSSTREVNKTMMASLFGNLLKVLSPRWTPVLFFFDDLQWADPLLLALLTSLIRGAGTESLNLSAASKAKRSQDDAGGDVNVLFVGSYRDNEVDDDSLLAKVLEKMTSDSAVHVTNIALARFSEGTLNEMLSESLCLPIRRVRSLSKLVIHKTDGQPLHVIEVIQALAMDNLLTHSFARGWEWDADSIDICPMTDSVAELFAFKLRKLPSDILLGLQIVSCFGFQVDQHIISYVADYDGVSSVDIATAIDVGLSKGLVERAGQLVSFSHDMIQKATIDTIDEDHLTTLLSKLAAALIKNATAVGDLDSVLFVIVDLINRIGSDVISCPLQRVIFADLNLKAGTKAISVPDFAAAATYAESGISFLSDHSWETQYKLSLRLYETAVLSHFSTQQGNLDRLKNRIDSVFEHAKDFSDKFKTHCVWIKLLSMTDLKRAIDESLNALDQLGEPLDLANVNYKMMLEEMESLKEKFSGKRKQRELSMQPMSDCNKMKAMMVMASLVVCYHHLASYLVAYVSCQMIRMTMAYGRCEQSVFCVATFACALVNHLHDIDEGSPWGKLALSLLNMHDNKDVLIPSIYPPLYSMVFGWKGKHLDTDDWSLL